jgi:septal ring factor EnvC (AmiA/AmiB activator)
VIDRLTALAMRQFRLLPLLLFLLWPTGPAVAELDQAEREVRAAELAKLRQRIEAITAQRNAVRTRFDQVQAELRRTERQISQQIQAIKKTRRRLRHKQRKLTRLQREQAALEKTVDRQRDLLGRQIRAAYMIGRQEYLKLLLNQQDPDAFGRTLVYYRYFNDARQGRIEKALGSIRQLEALGRRIEKEQQALKALQAEQLARRQELQKTRRARARVKAALGRQIASHEQELARLRQNERRLGKLLEAIEDSFSDLLPAETARSFASLRGRLSWPVQGKVRNLFGRARHRGGVNWNGVLIPAPEGKTVHAVARGRVAYADWLRGYGLLLILDHGDGYMSLYGHQQSLFKEVGDWVEAGEAIGSVGNSGGQDRTALYFEIRHNGRPANPAKWCARSRRTG